MDLFTKLWLFVTVWCQMDVNILLMSSPIGTIHRECILFYYNFDQVILVFSKGAYKA